jgi:hypothetical protein
MDCRGVNRYKPYVQLTQFINKKSEANKLTDETVTEKLIVTAFPNPYEKEFSLRIVSPVTGKATIEFFDLNGERIYQVEKFVFAGLTTALPYKGPTIATSVLYKVRIGNYWKSGFVAHPN